MTVKTINVEADSSEEARELVKAQIPKGYYLHSEQIILDGKPKTINATAETINAAYKAAQSKMPGSADILEKKELTAPVLSVIKVQAIDDSGAETEAKWQTRMNLHNPIVRSVKLVTPGSKGLLGLGKKPNQYEVELFQNAVIEITYKTKVEISFNIKEPDQTEVLELVKNINNIWVSSITRHNAANKLGTIGGDFVTEQLIKLFDTNEIEVRGLAILALESMKSELPKTTIDLLKQASKKYKQDIQTIEKQIDPLVSLLIPLGQWGSDQSHKDYHQKEKKIQQIGKMINDIGGHSAMWIPYRAIKAQYKYPPLGSILESRWDGIGTWRR